MESEKVKEIKKAFENIKSGLGYFDEQNKLVAVGNAEILKHINELESENSKLLEENESLNGSWKNAIKRIAELEKEIKENAFYSKGYAQGIKNTYEVVIPDKLKQFAEKLKEKMTIHYPSTIEAIDETLKEFIKE